MKTIPFENKYELIDEAEVSSIIRKKNIRSGYIRINRNIVEVCESCLKLNKIYAIYCRGCKKNLLSNKNISISESIDVKSQENIDNSKLKETRGDINISSKDFFLNILQSLIIISKIGQIQIINVLNNNNHFIDSISRLLSENELICDVKTDMKYLYFLTTKHIKVIPLYIFDLNEQTISNPVEQLENKEITINISNNIKSKISKNIRILEKFDEELDSESKLFLIGNNENFEPEYIIKSLKKVITNNTQLREFNSFLNKIASYKFLDKLKLSDLKIIFEQKFFEQELLDIYFYTENIIFLLKESSLCILDIKNNSKVEIELKKSKNLSIISGFGVSDKILILAENNLYTIDIKNKKIIAEIEIEKNNLDPVLYRAEDNDIILLFDRSKIKKYLINSDQKEIDYRDISVNITFLGVVSRKVVVISDKVFNISAK